MKGCLGDRERHEHTMTLRAPISLTLQLILLALQDTQDLEYADRGDEGLGYDREEMSTQKKEVMKMKNRRS